MLGKRTSRFVELSTYDEDSSKKVSELINGNESGTLDGGEDDRDVLADEALESSDSTVQGVNEVVGRALDVVHRRVLGSDEVCQTSSDNGRI